VRKSEGPSASRRSGGSSACSSASCVASRLRTAAGPEEGVFARAGPCLPGAGAVDELAAARLPAAPGAVDELAAVPAPGGAIVSCFEMRERLDSRGQRGGRRGEWLRWPQRRGPVPWASLQPPEGPQPPRRNGRRPLQPAWRRQDEAGASLRALDVLAVKSK
jgi:hypothetical protein